MSSNISTPVALVLAGTRGLGFACAERLVLDGNKVAICGRNEVDVLAAEERLNALGTAMGIVADVSNPNSVVHMMGRVRHDFGTIGSLVASAGGPPPGTFENTPETHWYAAFELTLMSVVRSAMQVIPGMIELGRGRIIIIGSSSVRKPIPNLTLSNTFRPALNGLVKDLAVTYASGNITVNMVAPGRIDTDRVRNLDEKAAERQQCAVNDIKSESLKKIPAGRYGQAAEFAAAVGFLASDNASYITGQTILVDGGMTASIP